METIRQIKERLDTAFGKELEELLIRYESDERKGVQAVVKSHKNRLERYRKEVLRIEELCRYEKKYASCNLICGIDEVGRGPLAGPVVAGAVILPKDCRILYINDSKKLSAAKREELSSIIKKEAVAFAFGMSSAQRIDEINILQATYEAMRKAIQGLGVVPDLLLNDAVTIPEVEIRQVPIIGGDGKSISIGAASILAKVYRDAMMEEFDTVYPGYGFASNKGYGSARHIQALKELGPCPIHRRTFIQRMIG